MDLTILFFNKVHKSLRYKPKASGKVHVKHVKLDVLHQHERTLGSTPKLDVFQ